ncbi:MAG: YhfC family intramembrane metalloprotease, partial [Oscillospiraceae bacterium]|nr:YhfC family intramembrane metalloprotease [Oscillospiraceae bacterium]
MFSSETMAVIAVGMVLGFAIPIAAIVIYKRRFREAWLPSAFIGTGAVIVFALIELLLYVPLLPIIMRIPSASVIISAVMAGVVEETARLAAYKTLMKNHRSTKNAVLMGLGFGGLETIVALGLTFLLYLIMA